MIAYLKHSSRATSTLSSKQHRTRKPVRAWYCPCYKDHRSNYCSTIKIFGDNVFLLSNQLFLNLKMLEVDPNWTNFIFNILLHSCASGQTDSKSVNNINTQININTREHFSHKDCKLNVDPFFFIEILFTQLYPCSIVSRSVT